MTDHCSTRRQKTGAAALLPSAARLSGVAAICLLAANCANDPGKTQLTSRVDPKYGVTASPRVIADENSPVPKGGGVYRVGKPYMIAGKMYYPSESHIPQVGIASWYGRDFHGRRTANGEIYDMRSITAAHPTMPLPSYARVTNLANGKSIIVRVNDRGPYHGNRVIDLSSKVAELLQFKHLGVARVKVERVGKAPIDGSDDLKLASTLRDGTPAQPPSAVMVASTQPFGPRAAPAVPETPRTIAAVTRIEQKQPVVVSATPVAQPVVTETVAHKTAPAPKITAPKAAPAPATAAVVAPAAKPGKPASLTPAIAARVAPDRKRPDMPSTALGYQPLPTAPALDRGPLATVGLY